MFPLARHLVVCPCGLATGLCIQQVLSEALRCCSVTVCGSQLLEGSQRPLGCGKCIPPNLERWPEGIAHFLEQASLSFGC